MITLNEPKVIATSQIIGEPQIFISGSSENNTRQAHVVCHVTNENGETLTPIDATFSGEEFNTFYESFTSDKNVVNLLFEKNGISVDISELNDDFVNIIE